VPKEEEKIAILNGSKRSTRKNPDPALILENKNEDQKEEDQKKTQEKARVVNEKVRKRTNFL